MSTASTPGQYAVATETQRGLSNFSDIRTGLLGLGNPNQNYIINGAMDFNQRGSLTQTDSTLQDSYCLDRFLLAVSSTTGGTGQRSVIQDTDVPISECFRTSLKLTVTTALSGGRSTYFVYRMERGDALTLLNKTVVVSFWAKASTPMTIGGGFAVVTPNILGNQSVSLTTSWQRFSFPVTISSVSGSALADLGLQMTFLNRAYASGESVWLTGVQLNIGSIVMPFQRAGIFSSIEDLLCKRYYYRISGAQGVTVVGLGQCVSSTQARIHVRLPVPMRTIQANASITRNGIYVAGSGGGDQSVTSLADAPISPNHSEVFISANVAAGLVAGNATTCYTTAGSGAYIDFNSEL